MRIYLNQQEEQMEFPPGASLSEVMGCISQKIAHENEVITHVRVNGQEVDEDENGNYPGVSIGEIDSVELQTGSAREIACRSLSDAVSYLGNLNPGIKKTAELFRVGEEAEAHVQYGLCVEGIKWFLHILEGVKQVQGLDYQEILFSGPSIQSHIEKLEQTIRDMWKAQSDRDWIMLSDLLEYELFPVMEAWKEILPLLGARINKVTGGTREVETPQKQ